MIVATNLVEKEKAMQETYRVAYSAASGLVHPCEHEDVAWTRFESLGTLDDAECQECGDTVDEAWICLDGGDVFCVACAQKEGLRFVPCAECGDIPPWYTDTETDSM